jgi:flavin-dependent dehydrogenase
MLTRRSSLDSWGFALGILVSPAQVRGRLQAGAMVVNEADAGGEPMGGRSAVPSVYAAVADATYGAVFDAVIVGGGPAGAATALALARRGRSVALADRAGCERPKVGEMLPPMIRGPLTALGLWEQFLSHHHLAVPGVVSVWGGGKPVARDFIFDPAGTGWHVDRCRFDAMLIGAAEAAGALVLRGTSIAACAAKKDAKKPHTHGGDWQVSTDCGAAKLKAHWLVCASGRTTPAGLNCGGRLTYDRLVGVVQTFEGAGGRDCRTWIEACEQGWWYSAALPRGQQVATFMTDRDLLPSNRAGIAEALGRWFDAAPRTRAQLAGARPIASHHIVSASTFRRRRVAGPNWLAVGDAACAFDPLSAHGIYKALTSGLAAAKVIDWDLSSPGVRFSAPSENYARAIEDGFADYLADRAGYYAMERRWPNSIFWRRRQSHR